MSDKNELRKMLRGDLWIAQFIMMPGFDHVKGVELRKTLVPLRQAVLKMVDDSEALDALRAAVLSSHWNEAARLARMEGE